MAARACVFLLALLWARSLSVEIPRQLVVWNVGQGQWVTLRDERGCWHFDLGGEFAPWASAMELCRAERNFVFISHWDWDHVGLLGRARFYLPNICLSLAPPGETPSLKKGKLVEGMNSCSREGLEISSWSGTLLKNANASSRVIRWRSVLLPGDSPRDQEKFWVRELDGLQSVRLLVLGHHGSATSTGKDLLRALSGLQVAVASARYRRYGHPHPRVLADLRLRRIPVLRTEDWGSLRFEL